MALNILDYRMAVIAELPETKNLFIEQLMLNGIQEICKDTMCWTEEITGMLSVKDLAIYPMTITTSNAEVIGFKEGKYNDATMPPMSNRTMDSRDSKWETRSGTPDGAIYDGDMSIRFNVTPDTSGTSITLEPYIQPNSVNGVVPPKIERRHLEAIKSYVKWKVYENPKTFNAELAVYFENDYANRKGRLKVEVAQDGEVLEVRPRSFVTGRHRTPISFPVD